MLVTFQTISVVIFKRLEKVDECSTPPVTKKTLLGIGVTTAGGRHLDDL